MTLNVSQIIAELPKIAAWIGAARVVLHPVNIQIDNYVRRNVSPEQFQTFQRTVGLFTGINFIIHLLTSISPASLNAAYQVMLIGDRDQRILVPYQASKPLPVNDPDAGKGQQ